MPFGPRTFPQKGYGITQTAGKRERVAASLTDRIVHKLDDLPETALREVLEFVESLTWRPTSQDEPLLSVAGILSGDMLSAEEIEREVYGDGKAHNES